MGKASILSPPNAVKRILSMTEEDFYDFLSRLWAMLIWGTVVSAVVSFLAVKWLLRYVQTHTFVLFGWYRIALGALILVVGR